MDTKDTFKNKGDRETISSLSRFCKLQKQFASRIANHMERVKSIAHQCLCFDNCEVLTYPPGVTYHYLDSFITVFALYLDLYPSSHQWNTMKNEVAESSSNLGARPDVLCATKRIRNIEVRNNSG